MPHVNTVNHQGCAVIPFHIPKSKFSLAFWKKCLGVISALTIGSTFSASTAGEWIVGSGDETTLTGVVTATTNPLIKKGTGVGILAPSGTNNIASVDIQAGTFQINAAPATSLGGSCTGITIEDGATLAAGTPLTLDTPITIGAGPSETGNITGLGYNGSGATLPPSDITLSGAIGQPLSGSGNTLALKGGAVIKLTADNTANNPLTGGITVSDTGTNLCIGHASAIPMALQNGIDLGAGTILSTASGVSPTVSSVIELSGAASILPAAFTTLILSGVVSGAGELTVGASGVASVVKLNASNTNNGTVAVEGGTLVLAHASAVAAVTSLALANSATLKLDTASTPIFAPPITCDGGATITGTQAATLSGNIYNANVGTLAITGTAVVTHSGDQYKSGITQADFPITTAGTGGLKLDGTKTLTSGNINVGSGTSFQVTGNKVLANAITFG